MPKVLKWLLGILVILVIFALAAFFGWRYWNQLGAFFGHSKPFDTDRSAPLTTESNSIDKDPLLFVPSNLKQLADLHLIEPRAVDESGKLAPINYYEDGNIAIGGSKVILAIDYYCDGAGCTPTFYRFLQDSQNYKLLTKYSAPIGGDLGLDPKFLKVSQTDIDVPLLDIPATIQDPRTKITLKYDSGLISGYFFNPSNKVLLFSANGYDIFVIKNANEEIFYSQAVDGKEIYFSPSDEVLNFEQTDPVPIKWKDGSINGEKYDYDISWQNLYKSEDLENGNFANCEEGDYAKIANDQKISVDDLTPIGSYKGQTILGLNDQNHPLLLAAQTQFDKINSDKTSQPKYLIIFWQDHFGRLIRLVASSMLEFCGGKPVIYLYPEQTEKISVKVDPVGGISTSSPNYENGWNVVANPDGRLISAGQDFPYLFWEGGLGSYKSPEKGFVVANRDVPGFLAEKLGYIGLNQKEITDFKEFWVPKMKATPYYFVTFSTNETMNQFAPLMIAPKPDSIIRVLMDYRPLESPIEVLPIDLPQYSRSGFTVVEWGGVLK